ncbi:MAG: hypothetical protein IT537_03105 [Hyphomicrobiales bacterium]|nr:hypothetical protein [Hyphomicrobiales bacterium]
MGENERLAVLEQRVQHMEGQVETMATKVDEMHAILLQAKGVRWTVLTVASIVGTLTAALMWMAQHVQIR